MKTNTKISQLEYYWIRLTRPCIFDIIILIGGKKLDFWTGRHMVPIRLRAAAILWILFPLLFPGLQRCTDAAGIEDAKTGIVGTSANDSIHSGQPVDVNSVLETTSDEDVTCPFGAGEKSEFLMAVWVWRIGIRCLRRQPLWQAYPGRSRASSGPGETRVRWRACSVPSDSRRD